MESKILEEMLVNPSNYFTAPSEVPGAPGLTKDEKIAVLKQWALDSRLLMVAAEEGMSGGERNVLRAVHAALAALGVVENPDDNVGVNKSG